MKVTGGENGNGVRRRRLPRSFKDLTPAKHFNPRTFFQELILKGWLTPRHGEHKQIGRASCRERV